MFSSNNLCNVRCKCTNCKNTRDFSNSVATYHVESDTDDDVSEDEQIAEGEDFDVQLYVFRPIHVV